MTAEKEIPRIIPPHGGYSDLMSFQMAEIVFDATAAFCGRFVSPRSRTHDQMVQAARSGKQNIAEGCMASGTSKKTEIKLIGVARASLEELLLDYRDFLRLHHLEVWPKDYPLAKKIRSLCYSPNRSYTTYRTYIENQPVETSANTIICIIHQTSFLLDQQLRILGKEFLTKGGFSERLYQARSEHRTGREKS
ncbi:MAG: four helix bundle protein [Dehalococcoidales bacterium]|nr:four helix bundle protein [Dehalococcoidales bacterium]